jgi:hypothetical protein
MLLVVVLGLLAALVLAVSASLQQRAARLAGAAHDHHGDRPRGRLLRVLPILGLARSLARSRIWVYGQLTNVLGVLIQGAALHLGSVAVVQPLIATELFFALPLGSVWTRRWPSLRDWFSGGAIVAGIALFLSVRGATPLEGRADRAKVLIASLSVIVFVALIVAVAANRGAATYAALLALAGGLCSATSAVFMKLTSEDLVGRGVAATALDWPGYALALSTLCAPARAAGVRVGFARCRDRGRVHHQSDRQLPARDHGIRRRGAARRGRALRPGGDRGPADCRHRGPRELPGDGVGPRPRKVIARAAAQPARRLSWRPGVG